MLHANVCFPLSSRQRVPMCGSDWQLWGNEFSRSDVAEGSFRPFRDKSDRTQ